MVGGFPTEGGGLWRSAFRAWEKDEGAVIFCDGSARVMLADKADRHGRRNEAFESVELDNERMRADVMPGRNAASRVGGNVDVRA